MAFDGIAVLLGLGLLSAAGLVRPRLWDVLAAAGAALIVGMAAIGTVTIAALTAGLHPGVLVVAIVALAAALAAGALGVVRARRAPAPAEPMRRPTAAVWAPVAGVAVFVVAQLVASRDVGVAWDAAHIWTVKAMAIASTDGLDGQLFSEHSYLPTSHQDYPLMQPVIGSLLLRFADSMRQGVLIGQIWVLIGAAVLAVPWLYRSGPKTWLAVVPLALAVAAAPNQGVLRGDADVLMACFLMVGAASLGRLVETSERGYAVPAALALAAAANTKNEGLVFAAALVACALVLALVARRGAWAVAAVGVVAALLAAPWRLWVSAHGPFASDVTPLSTSLDPGYLADRLDQLDLGARELLGHFADPGYGLTVPALIACAGAAILARRCTRIATFHLTGLLLVVLALLWVYWTSQQPDVSGHITRTTLRTVTAPLFLAAAGLAHLLPQLVPPPSGGQDERAGAARNERIASST